MKKIIFLLFIVLILSNCSKFLEEDNKGGISNEDFYSTVVGYQTLMTASYATLRTTYGQQLPRLILLGTDLYQEGKGGAGSNLGLYEYANLYPSDEGVTQFYNNCYKAIQTINTALYYNNFPKGMSDAVKNSCKAELRFLRAFYHFILVEQFGGVTINDQITLEPRMNMPRNTLADCYEFIISEIEESINDLDVNTVARVNKDVANHYLAKIYLTRGWDLGNDSDFTKAKTYAQKVISGKGPITLTYESLWDPDNENNSEIIFAIQYDNSSIASTTSGNTQQAAFGAYMGGSENHQKIMSGTNPSWSLHNWYAENDARYGASFMLMSYENYFDYYTVADKSSLKIRAYYPRVWGRDYTTTELNAWKATHTLATPFLYFPWVEPEDVYRDVIAWDKDFGNPTIKKFDSPASREYGVVSSSASVRDIVLARLAETYFLYAEACIGLSDFATAASYVQQVLNRPGNALTGTLTNTIASSPDRQEALHRFLIESGKEFIGEYNGRWPELRRTGMLEYMLEKYNYDIKQQAEVDFNIYKLRPIPEDAIILNEGISEEDQNPGY